MKQYKHKKTGRIAKDVGNKNSFYIKENYLHIPKEYIENSCDWEEIVDKKPEYTILSFGEKAGGWYKSIDGKTFLYHHNMYKGSSWSLEQLLTASYCAFIHSVRRESDGEIFTIGDLVRVDAASGVSVQDTISKFEFGTDHKDLPIIEVFFTLGEWNYIHNLKNVTGKPVGKVATETLNNHKDWEILSFRYRRWCGYI